MGETISCLNDEDEIGTGNPTSSQDIIDFTEDPKDILNLSFSFSSCVSDENLGVDGYDINRDEFVELSQEDLPIGISSYDIDQRLSLLSKPMNCLYQVPPNLDKPVGLRRYPHKNSPRTGDIIHPGDVIKIIQEIEIDQIKYLKTNGDGNNIGSGWLFQSHPIHQTVMLEYLSGELIQKQQSYMYKLDQPLPITILTGPNENCSKTNHVIFPGEEIDICEIWKPSPTGGAGAGAEAGDEKTITYVKLCDGRGWVELYHPITNNEMFSEIIP